MALTIDSVVANDADAAIDVALSGGAFGAKVDIERRIPIASHNAALALGVPPDEVGRTDLVTRDHVLINGAGTWQDYQVRSKVTYEYRAREGTFSWTHDPGEVWAS